MNSPSTSAAAPERLSFREKLAYGLGDTASNFYFQLFNQFLVYYYTDIFGLASKKVGTLMLVTTILGAVVNPFVGAVADRTTTRWGKFRPYIAWGAIPYGLLGVLMFANPSLSLDAKLIYAYVTYALVLVVYAAINTPYGALMGVMSPSSEERTSLSTYRFACAFLGALLIGALVPVLKDALAGASGSPAVGFRNTMALFSVVSVGLFFFTFANTRERVAPPTAQKSSFGRDVSDLCGNVPWLILFFVAFLNLTNVGMRSGAAIYYFKYCVGDEAGLAGFNFWGFIFFIAGALSTKFLLRFVARREMMISLTVLNALAMAAFYFVDPHSRVTLNVLNIVGQFAAGPTPAIVWSLYADTADFGEWKFGRRATGLIFSATVFSQKVGLALGGALIGWLQAYFGFVANAVQTPAAIQGIKLLFAVLPAVFGGLSGLMILFYKIDEPLVKQIEQELAERKAAATAPVAA